MTCILIQPKGEGEKKGKPLVLTGRKIALELKIKEGEPVFS